MQPWLPPFSNPGRADSCVPVQRSQAMRSVVGRSTRCVQVMLAAADLDHPRPLSPCSKGLPQRDWATRGDERHDEGDHRAIVSTRTPAHVSDVLYVEHMVSLLLILNGSEIPPVVG